MVADRLWLDDQRPAPPGWHHVTNYVDFCQYLGTQPSLREVSFDHDLGEDPYNGATCARYLVEHCLANNRELPKCWVHSGNPEGAKNIASILNSGARVIGAKEE